MDGDFLTTLLWILAAIITASGAVTAIVKFYQWLHNPSKDNAHKIKDLEAANKSVYEKLDNDNKRLIKIDADMKMLLSVQLTLLEHEITGNSINKLKVCKEELINYLVGV